MKRGAPLKSFARIERRTRLLSSARLVTRSPLKSSGRINPKRARRIDRETPQETRYKAWIHGPWQSCDLLVSVPGHRCSGIGGLQAAHLRDMTGLGLKGSWLETIPACPGGHDEIDGRAPSEFFGAMTLDEKKAWMRERIAVHDARFAANVEVLS